MSLHVLLATNPYDITAQEIGLSGGTANVGTGIGQIADTMMVLLGMLAVVMIIVGALRYVSSNGDEKNAEAAKNTILYAVIGLIVAIAAYGIVTFVSTLN